MSGLKYSKLLILFFVLNVNMFCTDKNGTIDERHYYLLFRYGFNNDEVEIYYDGVFQRKVVVMTDQVAGAVILPDSLCIVPKNTKTIEFYLPELDIRSKYSIILNENKVIGIWLHKENKEFSFKQHGFVALR